MEQRPRSPFEVVRTICGALFGCVGLAWILVGLIVRSGALRAPAAGLVPPVGALLIGVVLGIIASTGGLVVRFQVLKAVERARRDGWPAEAAGAVSTLLLLGWAVTMGAGLFSGILLVVLGDLRVLWAAVPLCVLAMASIAPRAEWYAPVR